MIMQDKQIGQFSWLDGVVVTGWDTTRGKSLYRYFIKPVRWDFFNRDITIQPDFSICTSFVELGSFPPFFKKENLGIATNLKNSMHIMSPKAFLRLLETSFCLFFCKFCQLHSSYFTLIVLDIFFHDLFHTYQKKNFWNLVTSLTIGDLLI